MLAEVPGMVHLSIDIIRVVLIGREESRLGHIVDLTCLSGW
jgi:hypothetical protein